MMRSTHLEGSAPELGIAVSFERQAFLTPQSLASVNHEATLPCPEFNHYAKQIARGLRRNSVTAVLDRLTEMQTGVVLDIIAPPRKEVVAYLVLAVHANIDSSRALEALVSKRGCSGFTAGPLPHASMPSSLAAGISSLSYHSTTKELRIKP
jgi:hypothetical protein